VVSAVPVRRSWTVIQIALIAAAVGVAVLFTVIAPGPVPPHFRPATLGDQPRGAVVLAREDGQLAVGVAAAPRHGQLLVVATVFGPSGGGAAGLRTSFAITTSGGRRLSAAARACTAGCYQAAFATAALPRRVSITFNGGSRIGFTFPRRGPSASALRLVRAAAAEYRRVHTLVTHESLGSSPTQVVDTTYYAVAPDKLRFVVRGEDESIIIGDRRWDRRKGGRWTTSAQTPIKPIAPYWAPKVQDATILSSAKVHGHRTWKVSFADPQTPGFFTIWVDKANDRTRELEMTAAAHFMHHTYGPFNAPLNIQPPNQAG
jgi:hypothetical protein